MSRCVEEVQSSLGSLQADIKQRYLAEFSLDGLGGEGAAVGTEDFWRFLTQYELDAFV